MNAASLPVDCSFHFGPEDYSFTGPYNELKVEEIDSGDVIITTHVLMTSGCYIDGGSVSCEGNTITLTYTSWDDGLICLEQYSRELRFTIPRSTRPATPNYLLTNKHESRPSFDERLQPEQ